MIYGKNVVLGVSGGIAAYKSCEIVSSLRKLGANVDVVLTKHAEEFVTPLTFETLSGNAAVRGMFDERKEFDVRHVSLAKKADILLVAPATADVIAKFARGECSSSSRTRVCSPAAIPARAEWRSRPKSSPPCSMCCNPDATMRADDCS